MIVIKESFGNSGYVGQSKSVRAVQAENDGLLKISEINKSLILSSYLKSDFFDKEKYKHYKSLPASAFKDLVLATGASEWHHTGKYYNRTNYYDLADIVDNIEYLDDYVVKKSSKEEKFLSKLEDIKKFADLGFVTHTTLTKVNRYRWNSEEETYRGINYDDWVYVSPRQKFKTSANSNKYKKIDIHNKKVLKDFLRINNMNKKITALLFYYTIVVEKVFSNGQDRKRALEEIKIWLKSIL